jgi:hypothetical protein
MKDLMIRNISMILSDRTLIDGILDGALAETESVGNLDGGGNLYESDGDEICTEDKNLLTLDDGILNDGILNDGIPDKSESSGILDNEDDRNLEDDETLIDKNDDPCDPFDDKMDMEMEGLDDENDDRQIDDGSL